MRKRKVIVVSVMAVLFGVMIGGCAGPKKPGKSESESGPNAQLLEPLLLAQKPEKSMSVIQAREETKDGDEVILEGKVPPECTVPFNPGLASFILMSPKDLDDPNIKEELECDDAAT